MAKSFWGDFLHPLMCLWYGDKIPHFGRCVKVMYTTNTISMPVIATNKYARSDYEILDTYEAGVKLSGPEVKSIKKGQVNLKGSYATVGADGRARLLGVHVAPYKPAAGVQQGYDPTRSRELLLNKKELASLIGKLKEKRYTLLPLAVFNKSGIIKIELGLGRGKKQYEKREAIKKRDIEREIGRNMRR